ncbi:MAG: helix-turn-helix transcriptional regulator [Brevibacillus sp.]|nr:helix-turn-helix transcriptional regulator [Brevibacillus sp.]
MTVLNTRNDEGILQGKRIVLIFYIEKWNRFRVVKSVAAVKGAIPYTTIGEIVRKYREKSGLTLAQLERQTGVRKGVISKIENGETKRPELKTIQSLSGALNISYQEIVKYYIEIEKRIDVLQELLLQTIPLANLSLLEAVALKMLESPYQDTYTALERLYQLANTITHTESKLTLYNLMIQYSRERGVPQFIAKGLLQKYLIERQDLKRLEESYRIGEELYHYKDFLSVKEQTIFYFRMALHAHNTKKYQDCIKFCEAGLKLETTETELKARAYLAMINAYYFLEEYDAAEKHLEVFEHFPFVFVRDAAKITRACVKAKKRQFNEAITILQACMQEVGEELKIHAANELLDIYFQLEDWDSIAKLVRNDEELLLSNPQTPYKHVSIGKYYQWKGSYLLKAGEIDEGIESYVKSLKSYGEVLALQEIIACINDIFLYFRQNKFPIETQYVEKLGQVYNSIAEKILSKR